MRGAPLGADTFPDPAESTLELASDRRIIPIISYREILTRKVRKPTCGRIITGGKRGDRFRKRQPFAPHSAGDSRRGRCPHDARPGSRAVAATTPPQRPLL